MKTGIPAQRAGCWSLFCSTAYENTHHENTSFPCCISAILFLVQQDENTRAKCQVFSFSVLDMKFKNPVRENKLPSNEKTASHVEIFTYW